MLNVTILKAMHSGREQARKLLPYIQKADVYAPEQAAATELDARELEADWEKVLSYSWSRTKFLQATREILQRQENSELSAGAQEFIIAEKDYLYQNRVPFWHLERFGENEATDVLARQRHFERTMDFPPEALEQGKISDLEECYWKKLEILLSNVEERVREIARNIDRAEQCIRERYPSLARKEEIKLVAMIGDLHRPEDYASLQVNSVYLIPEPKTITDQLARALAERKQFDECRPLITKLAALKLVKEGKFPGVTPLEEADIEQMPYSDLVALLSTPKSKNP